MIDITTITELVEPFNRIEVAAPKFGYKAKKDLWAMVIITIAIFGIWGLVVFREKQNENNGDRQLQ